MFNNRNNSSILLKYQKDQYLRNSKIVKYAYVYKMSKNVIQTALFRYNRYSPHWIPCSFVFNAREPLSHSLNPPERARELRVPHTFSIFHRSVAVQIFHHTHALFFGVQRCAQQCDPSTHTHSHTRQRTHNVQQLCGLRRGGRPEVRRLQAGTLLRAWPSAAALEGRPQDRLQVLQGRHHERLLGGLCKRQLNSITHKNICCSRLAGRSSPTANWVDMWWPRATWSAARWSCRSVRWCAARSWSASRCAWAAVWSWRCPPSLRRSTSAAAAAGRCAGPSARRARCTAPSARWSARRVAYVRSKACRCRPGTVWLCRCAVCCCRKPIRRGEWEDGVCSWFIRKPIYRHL